MASKKEISLRDVDEKTSMSSFESTIKRVEEYQKVMEKTQTLQSQLLGNIEGVFPAEVKFWGTSAHIPFLKKYGGRKVKILLLKEEDDEQKV